MSRPLLSLTGVHKSFGDVQVIRGANLEVVQGERHAVIGPNGAGKSTLFNLVSGQFAPTHGEITFDDKSIAGLSPESITRRGLARSFQITQIFPGLSVFENLRFAVIRRHGLQITWWNLIERNKLVRAQTSQLLEQIRLTHRRDQRAGELGYSEQRALEIGLTVGCEPQLMLLDEPMAGMSRDETDHAVALIREVTRNRTLLIVEHDMDVVFALCDRISVLVYGEVIATGTPAEIRNNLRVREAYLGSKAFA